MRLLVALLVWLTFAVSASATPSALDQALKAGAAPVAAGPQRTERIEAELVPMSAWATPGSTAIVAVRQKIKPGWHTYWRNQGDSGGPTTLSWSLPDDVVPGDILWPLPERQRLQSLMNYGYSDVVFLPVPLRVPASVQPGQILTLRVTAHFYVCSDEMCVPEDLDLALSLPVRDGAAPLDPRHGQAIQAVVASAPRPAGIEARAAFSDGRLTLTAVGGPLADAPPKWAYFFPFEGGIIDHAAAQAGQRGPQGLTLTLAPGRGLTANGLKPPLAGVLSTDLGAWEISAEQGAALAGASGEGPIGDGEAAQKLTPGATTIAAFLQAALFALLGGLILNLMPCVFPILAMKAAALSRSAHEPAEARRDGLAFLAGVLATFLVLAGALLALRAGGQALGWGFQLQSPGVVAALSLLMLTVALNLSGVFQVGAGLQGAGHGPLARLPGAAGAFFTGVLAVVVAAPFVASAQARSVDGDASEPAGLPHVRRRPVAGLGLWPPDRRRARLAVRRGPGAGPGPVALRPFASRARQGPPRLYRRRPVADRGNGPRCPGRPRRAGVGRARELLRPSGLATLVGTGRAGRPGRRPAGAGQLHRRLVRHLQDQ